MKKNIVIIFLILWGLGLSGYICYDKFFSKNDNDSVKEKDEKENESLEEVQDNKLSFDISYKEEVYTTRNKSGYIISTSKRNLPVINNSNNQDIAKKIVLSLTGISDKEWNENIKSMADEVVEMEGYENTTEDMNLGVTYLFTTGICTDRRLTFKLEMNGSFGGVSWSGESGYNYDARNGNILKLESIAYDYDKLMDAIIEKVENNLKSDSYSCLIDDYSSQLENLINMDGNWYFTDKGIRIVFPKYSIACGAGGVIGIDIDKNVVNDYIKDEYKV